MLNTLRSYYFRHSMLFIILCAFTITYSVPLNANPISPDMAFTMRMENAKNVINALMQKNSLNDLIHFFFVLKTDIETYCKIKIDFDEYFLIIHNEFESRGTHISKKSMDTINLKFKMWE